MSRNSARSVQLFQSHTAKLLQIIIKYSLVDYFLLRVLVRSVFVNYFHGLSELNDFACNAMAWRSLWLTDITSRGFPQIMNIDCNNVAETLAQLAVEQDKKFAHVATR
jgi:hypothetical protein